MNTNANQLSVPQFATGPFCETAGVSTRFGMGSEGRLGDQGKFFCGVRIAVSAVLTSTYRANTHTREKNEKRLLGPRVDLVFPLTSTSGFGTNKVGAADNLWATGDGSCPNMRRL